MYHPAQTSQIHRAVVFTSLPAGSLGIASRPLSLRANTGLVYAVLQHPSVGPLVSTGVHAGSTSRHCHTKLANTCVRFELKANEYVARLSGSKAGVFSLPTLLILFLGFLGRAAAKAAIKQECEGFPFVKRVDLSIKLGSGDGLLGW